ncbi:MAG: type II toxin-antitoxin system VapC family toxin [Puniceicoccaceae bacterium]
MNAFADFEGARVMGRGFLFDALIEHAPSKAFRNDNGGGTAPGDCSYSSAFSEFLRFNLLRHFNFVTVMILVLVLFTEQKRRVFTSRRPQLPHRMRHRGEREPYGNVIDDQREVKAKTKGPVAAFLKDQANECLQISPVAWGEFLAGFPREDHPFVHFVRDRVEFATLSTQVASTYQKVYRSLKANGCLMGANDLWIACHAMSLEQALVTRNAGDFRRIPNLRLLEY